METDRLKFFYRIDIIIKFTLRFSGKLASAVDPKKLTQLSPASLIISSPSTSLFSSLYQRCVA